MKQTVNFSTFCDAFKPDRTNSFSYEGKRALFDYLEQMEEETGEEMELDVIAFCCEFTEYDSIEDVIKDYTEIESIEDLRMKTNTIEFNHGSLIIQNF